MSKKLKKYKGFFLLESLVSLSILSVLIGSYLSLTSFMLEKNKEVRNELTVMRILYEEIGHYQNYGGLTERVVTRNGQKYTITINLTENGAIGAKIYGNEIQFEIERK